MSSTIIIINHFYIALFSALEQTHCAHMWFYIFFFFFHHIALIASWVYNKGNFLHLVWKKGTGLQQNCCKVSDYRLGPALKKNPYIKIKKTFFISLNL